MQPTEVSTVLFAFAQMRFRDKDMMVRVAENTPAILGQFRAEDITLVLAAFARLDVQHKLIFNLFAREVARKLHDFTATQLGELVYAYARIGIKHELLLDVLKKRILEVIQALKPWHLAMVANGFARLGVVDERFFTLLAAEICKKLPDFTGRPLALIANAYARLGVCNRFLLELLGDECFRRRSQLEPQSVSMLLNAYARLGFPNPILFDYYAQDVPRRIRAYNMHSLCLVASAFARQRLADEKLFERIGNDVCQRALSLYPRAVASFLYSFSEVDIRHSVLFFNAPKHVAENVDAYSTDELCMVARAYGRFQMVHLPLFDTITEALPSRMLVDVASRPQLRSGDGDGEPDFRDDPPSGPSSTPPRISSLVGLLEAYARLTIYEAVVLELLCDAIVQRRGDLAPPLVVQATSAIAALSYKHPGLLAEAIRCAAEEGGRELSIEELAALTSAIEALSEGDGEGVRPTEPPIVGLLSTGHSAEVSWPRG